MKAEAAKKRKPPSMRHICRVDREVKGVHTWQVQVIRQGRKAWKTFTDSVWGGKRQALAAAIAWRDQHTEPLTQYVHELWHRNILRRNNTSGLVGVARYERKPNANGKTAGYAFWVASWIDENGTRRTRKFSVKAWGERGAKQKAIETREREVPRAVAARTGVGI